MAVLQAVRGGKTYGLLLEPLRNLKNKDFKAVIFRKNSVQVRNPGGLWDESFRMYSGIGKPYQGFLQWVFPSGMTVKFAHLEYEKDIYSWQGSQLSFLAFDELTHFSERTFWYMFSRVRSMSGIPGRIRCTCNPDSESWIRRIIDWWIGEDGFAIPERSGVVRWFIRQDDEMVWGDSPEELITKYGQDQIPKSVTFIPSLVHDNKILMEKDPSYLSNLMALPRIDRLRLLGGNWNVRASAGLYFQREWFPIVDAVPSGWMRMVRYWDRACLIKGTLVDTDKGLRPIEEIQVGDLVLTRKGFKPVTWSGISKRTDELLSVIFSDGKVLTGTSDHPIYTLRGWVCLEDLTSTDRVFNLTDVATDFTETSDTSIATNGIKKIRDTSIDLSIEMSGSTPLAIYPVASISTTKTEIGLTTQSKIWNASQEKNTHKNINTICHSKLISEIQSIELKHKQLFEHECKNTMIISAPVAGKNLKQEVLRQSIAAWLVSNLKNINAKFVNLLSERDDSIRNTVVSHVRTEGVPVYDISVEDTHEFFANGILVHNSTKPNESNRDPDWTRGIKLYKYRDGSYVVVDLKSIRASPGQVEAFIKGVASHDSKSCPIIGEEDPGSAGIADGVNFVRMLGGYNVRLRRNTKDKETRAKPVSAQAEVGNIRVLRASWNEEFFRELENFPEGNHDDIVDVLSGAFNELSTGVSILEVL